jgi:hypothetical protein
MYHIAANHRPKDSTSRAVRQRSLFEGNICWISLLELPWMIDKVENLFHGHFLMESKVIEKVKSPNWLGITLASLQIIVTPMSSFMDTIGRRWIRLSIHWWRKCWCIKRAASSWDDRISLTASREIIDPFQQSDRSLNSLKAVHFVKINE